MVINIINFLLLNNVFVNIYDLLKLKSKIYLINN